MRDVDARLGATVVALVQAARSLGPERLDDLLENVAGEIAVALLEEEARRTAWAGRPGNVVPFARGRVPGACPSPTDARDGS
ncbi:hypothetical protein [Methylobacterium sp. 1030]|uniref:hypothetical protein n=1 Tax=Methylobacterium sp. 1030 TaxID=3156404 RepID=UPI0033938FE1